jgi:hypothetical protein
MRFEEYLHDEINEGVLSNALKKIKKKSLGSIRKLFKDSWETLANLTRAKGLEKDTLRIINRHMGTRYKTLDQISKAKIQENTELNEDFAHWWSTFKGEAFPTLAFYPALSVWLELDKLFAVAGAAVPGVNWAKVGVYALMFVFLVSGKYLKQWQKWRKDNPEEAEKEKMTRKEFKTAKEKMKHTFRGI